MIEPEAQSCCGPDVRRDYEVSADNKTLRCLDCGKTYTRESVQAEAEPQGVELELVTLDEVRRFRHQFVGMARDSLIKRLLDTVEHYVRADLPRTTGELSDERARALAREIIGNVNNYAEDNGELSISAFGPLAKRIAAALVSTPRATGETAVEAALAELREMLPYRDIQVSWSGWSWQYPSQYFKDGYRAKIEIGFFQKFEGLTLADCMAQVRAASRTEGGGEKE